MKKVYGVFFRDWVDGLEINELEKLFLNEKDADEWAKKQNDEFHFDAPYKVYLLEVQ